MKVFVTGGAGYIGSVVVEQLVLDGHAVTVFDSLENGHRDALHPDAEFIEGDLRDKESIRAAVARSQPDAIMHFAAYAYVGESMRDPMKYFENNVSGSINLISAAVDASVKKFIFSSSCATYGVPESLPITEQTPQCPVNPYGESKLIVEQILKWAQEIHPLEAVMLRYFNAAGASERFGEDHDPETHIIPLAMRAVKEGATSFKIFGDQYETEDGTCVRDYIHVQDLAKAHVLALKPGISGALNLGNGKGFSVREVVSAVGKVTGKTVAAEMAPARPGDPPVLVAETGLASSVLGWMPQKPELAEILSDAWQWSDAHPGGYEA